MSTSGAPSAPLTFAFHTKLSSWNRSRVACAELQCLHLPAPRAVHSGFPHQPNCLDTMQLGSAVWRVRPTRVKSLNSCFHPVSSSSSQETVKGRDLIRLWLLTMPFLARGLDALYTARYT